MKSLTALVWKEWHEVRAFLWIALGIFIVLPVIGGLEALLQYDRGFEISTLPWVIAFGGVLAIFVAVGATCRDFSGHLEDFWRSRPVTVTRWLLVKYLVGLTVVLVACTFPLAIELAFNRDKGAILIVAWFPFLWATLYSIGFLAGCLVRRTAHAAMLALAAMLLVYCVPVVIPPLQWLNVSIVTDFSLLPGQWPPVFGVHQLGFAAGMLGLAIVVFVLALLAVHHDWRIGAGRKMMYGSVSAAVLILFASAAFQLGTNMPILRQIDMPQGEPIVDIYYKGGGGYVITRRDVPLPKTDFDRAVQYQYKLRTIKLTESGIELGNPVSPTKDQWFALEFYHPFVVHAPADPAMVYWVDDTGSHQEAVLWLYGFGRRILLWKVDRANFTRPILIVSRQHLYVVGRRLITFDITQPRAPRMISNVPFGYSLDWDPHYRADKFMVILPPVPDLSPRETLQAVVKPFGFFEGNILCESREQVLLAYRLTQLTKTKAVFEKIGQYEPTMLENMFGSINYIGGMRLQNGLLYVGEGHPSAWGNPHIDVFDTRGPHPLRLIGHFAAPGVGTVFPLPDGNALVGGEKLWLIGPPPHRGAE